MPTSALLAAASISMPTQEIALLASLVALLLVLVEGTASTLEARSKNGMTIGTRRPPRSELLTAKLTMQVFSPSPDEMIQLAPARSDDPGISGLVSSALGLSMAEWVGSLPVGTIQNCPQRM